MVGDESVISYKEQSVHVSRPRSLTPFINPVFSELPFNDAGRTTALNDVLNFPARKDGRDYQMSFPSFYRNGGPEK